MRKRLVTHDHIFLWVSLLADTSWSGMKEAKFGADTVTAFSQSYSYKSAGHAPAE